ncbi:hypothetical protein ACE6H2_010368 [Prunus campanulata]
MSVSFFLSNYFLKLLPQKLSHFLPLHRPHSLHLLHVNSSSKLHLLTPFLTQNPSGSCAPSTILSVDI